MSGGSIHGKRTLKYTQCNYVMSGGSRHGKRTLRHTRVRYDWRVKTW